MSKIVNDLLGSATRPYLTIAKVIAGLALIGAIIAFVWSWQDRGRQIEALTATQDSIVEAATVATVEPGEDGKRTRLKPSQVPAAIAALSSSLQSADEALKWISGQTLTAKRASEVADRALDRDLEAMRRDAAGRNLDEWDPWKREN